MEPGDLDEKLAAALEDLETIKQSYKQGIVVSQFRRDSKRQNNRTDADVQNEIAVEKLHAGNKALKRRLEQEKKQTPVQNISKAQHDIGCQADLEDSSTLKTMEFAMPNGENFRHLQEQVAILRKDNNRLRSAYALMANDLGKKLLENPKNCGFAQKQLVELLLDRLSKDQISHEAELQCAYLRLEEAEKRCRKLYVASASPDVST